MAMLMVTAFARDVFNILRWQILKKLPDPHPTRTLHGPDMGEHLFAFLDDVYVLCQPERAREVFDLLESKLLEHIVIHLHLGKTKVYNKIAGFLIIPN